MEICNKVGIRVRARPLDIMSPCSSKLIRVKIRQLNCHTKPGPPPRSGFITEPGRHGTAVSVIATHATKQDLLWSSGPSSTLVERHH